MSSLILGLLLPQAKLFFESKYSVYQIDFMLQEASVNGGASSEIVSSSFWTLANISWGVYYIGFAIVFSRLLYGLYRIYSLYHSGQKVKMDGFVKVINDKKQLPFSFFNYVFVGSGTVHTEAFKRIIQHEMVHINQRHSIDVLVTEFIHCIFWFNPLLLLYKRSIKENHEYIADHFTTKGYSKELYKKLLASESMSGLEIALTNQFFQSQIKNRISMLHSKKSSKFTLLRYAIAIPLIIGFIAMFSAYRMPSNIFESDLSNSIIRDTIPESPASPITPSKVDVPKPPTPPSPPSSLMVPPPPPAPPTPQKEVSGIFKVVEEMPRYPGCENKGLDKSELKSCSQELMLQQLYKSVKYPSIARKNGKEGTAVVQFVVDKDGSLIDFKLLRDPGFTMGDAALVASRTLGESKWIPGKQSGKVVKVMYTLPIKFKLEGEKKEVQADGSLKDKAIKNDLSEIDKDATYLLDGKVTVVGVIEDMDPDNIATIDISKDKNEVRVVSKKASENNLKLIVHQNEPNPFKVGEITSIRYSLDAAADVTFIFYGVNGESVYNTNIASQRGDNTLSLASNKLPKEGVYYYQVKALGESITRKLILIGQ